MLLFHLEDVLTGEIKTTVVPFGTTEFDVRHLHGGVWLDIERTICLPHCQF